MANTANLWHHTTIENWVRTEIHTAVAISRDAIDSIDSDNPNAASLNDTVVLYPSQRDQLVARWLLLAPSTKRVHINGVPLSSGIRVLADRDSIRVDDFSAVYFSTECLASVEPFPLTESVFCPRCKLPISEGDAAVCCPQCKVWHHEQVDAQHNCWTYTRICALCSQATNIDAASFRWTPEGL